MNLGFEEHKGKLSPLACRPRQCLGFPWVQKKLKIPTMSVRFFKKYRHCRYKKQRTFCHFNLVKNARLKKS